MSDQKNYGLIGKKLSHTFSPRYFNDFFEKNAIKAQYAAYEMDDLSGILELISSEKLLGFNVTIPYKSDIIEYLDVIDTEAAEIGAVNSVRVYDGRLYGYNTDVYGFIKSFTETWPHHYLPAGALVLGTGGASKAVTYGLKKLGVKTKLISRNTPGCATYEDIDSKMIEEYPLIVNTSPLGMHPMTNAKPPIPYSLLTEKNMLYDLIYNPQKTLFLSEGVLRKCVTLNGYNMLIYQAEKSWQIWNENFDKT